jgi:RNA polymerase sigma-70 factor (ECF subfamily)
LGELLEQYYHPIYCYLRRRGYSAQDARDLTQGFIADRILEKDLARRADRRRGRFRGYLLTSLRNYTSNLRRGGKAFFPPPRETVTSLEGPGGRTFEFPTNDLAPEQAFNYAWACACLDRVMAVVSDACERDGLPQHWRAFYQYSLEPLLTGCDRPGREEMCRRLGIVGTKRFSNMVGTVQRKFQDALREVVEASVDGREEVDGEICALIEALARGPVAPGDAAGADSDDEPAPGEGSP